MTMETIFYPEESRWEELCARPRTDTSALEAVCREIFDQVRTEGDAALRRYTERFDRVKVSDLAVSAEEFDRAQELVPPSLQQAIRTARENIEGFHLREVPRSLRWKSPQGVVCRQQGASDPPRGDLRAGWERSALFHGAHAGGAGRDRRLPRGGDVHPSRQGRPGESCGAVDGAPVRGREGIPRGSIQAIAG